jgi:hypothetical protein
MEQQVLKEVTQTQIEAVWWTLTYVVLPALAGSYGLTLACLKWLWNELKEIRANDLKHISQDIESIVKRLDRLEE